MPDFAVSQTKLKDFFSRRTLWGQSITPELIAILLVYFVQGILGLSQLAVSFFLKDEIGLSPTEVAVLTGIAAIPWTIKPLFGFLSDWLPLFGYRRRSYLILSGILGSAAWLAMATLVQTTGAVIAAILLSSIAIAMSDVIIDALVVERARTASLSDVGSLQSLAWGSTAVGGVITAYLGGVLLEQFSTRMVFGLTATFPLIVALVAGLIREGPIDQTSRWSTLWEQIKPLGQAVKQRSIWMPTVFILLWQSTPSANAAFFFFTTNDLGFEPEFLGRVQLVMSLASLLGVWVFHRFLRTVSLRAILGWSTVLSALLGMTMLLLVTHVNRSLGISDQWFSLGDSLVLTVMGRIAFMPVMVMAAQMCPPGVEATLFALLMAMLNLGALLSHESGALLTHWLGITETHFDRMWLLVLLTNLSTLLPLGLLGWLPSAQAQLARVPDQPRSRGQAILQADADPLNSSQKLEFEATIIPAIEPVRVE
jgi:folate/biopterin transporter